MNEPGPSPRSRDLEQSRQAVNLDQQHDRPKTGIAGWLPLRHWRAGMVSVVRSEHRLRAIALALVACALALRILIPPGWMPARTGDGWTITICTGTGPMRIAMPAGIVKSTSDAHEAPAKHGPAAGDHPCAFAGATPLFHTPAAAPPPVPMIGPAADPLIRAAAVAIGRGLAAPPPPATGPPHSF